MEMIVAPRIRFQQSQLDLLEAKFGFRPTHDVVTEFVRACVTQRLAEIAKEQRP